MLSLVGWSTAVLLVSIAGPSAAGYKLCIFKTYYTFRFFLYLSLLSLSGIFPGMPHRYVRHSLRYRSTLCTTFRSSSGTSSSHSSYEAIRKLDLLHQHNSLLLLPPHILLRSSQLPARTYPVLHCSHHSSDPDHTFPHHKKYFPVLFFSFTDFCHKIHVLHMLMYKKTVKECIFFKNILLICDFFVFFLHKYYL